MGDSLIDRVLFDIERQERRNQTQNLPPPPTPIPSALPPPPTGTYGDPAGLAISQDVALGGGGTALGLAQNALAGEGYWLGRNGQYYGTHFNGNGTTGGRNGIIAASRAFRVGGTVVFGIQSGVAINSAVQNPTLGNLTHQGFNIGAGVVGFMGPAGFGLSTLYFGVDATIGWNVVLDPGSPFDPVYVRGSNIHGFRGP